MEKERCIIKDKRKYRRVELHVVGVYALTNRARTKDVSEWGIGTKEQSFHRTL
jgi:hypothetical protein